MSESRLEDEIDNFVQMNGYIINNLNKLPAALQINYIAGLLDFAEALKPLYAVSVAFIEGGKK